MAWESMFLEKLRIFTYQKKADEAMLFADCFAHVKP